MSPEPEPVVQMANITKTFPGGVIANHDVSLSVWEGTIHAVIGENGAGKSTLMNVLFGRYQPDSGRIRIRGQDVKIDSPAKAIALGIGMVTQHTTMIPALTALDNIILGAEPRSAGVIDRTEALRRVGELAGSLGIEVDWNARAGTLSVAGLQKAEIVKALYRGARILILDEPTATLAPQEADSLFALLHSLADSGADGADALHLLVDSGAGGADALHLPVDSGAGGASALQKRKGSGVTAIMVTHKLREVMAHSSQVTVLRGGKTSGERITSETYPDDLLALMLGHKTATPGTRLARETSEDSPRAEAWERGPNSEMLSATVRDGERDGARFVQLGGEDVGARPMSAGTAPPTLEVRGVRALNDRGAPAVNGVSLDVRPGEIVGVAGVDGSGQTELAEAIVGLRSITGGGVWFNGEEITRLSVAARMRKGMAYVPEDRQRDGLVLDYTIAENMILGRQREPTCCGGRTLDLRCMTVKGENAVREHRIRARGGDTVVRYLSGGNQQKVVLARALDGQPKLLVAMQPTRGLDVEATRFVYDTLRKALLGGMGILLFSLDLDELFEMSTRIAVIYNGTLAGIVPKREGTPEGIGKLMVSGSDLS